MSVSHRERGDQQIPATRNVKQRFANIVSGSKITLEFAVKSFLEFVIRKAYFTELHIPRYIDSSSPSVWLAHQDPFFLEPGVPNVSKGHGAHAHQS